MLGGTDFASVKTVCWQTMLPTGLIPVRWAALEHNHHVCKPSMGMLRLLLIETTATKNPATRGL